VVATQRSQLVFRRATWLRTPGSPGAWISRQRWLAVRQPANTRCCTYGRYGSCRRGCHCTSARAGTTAALANMRTVLWYQRALAIDQLDETVHAATMQVQWRLGWRAAALEQFAQLKTLIRWALQANTLTVACLM